MPTAIVSRDRQGRLLATLTEQGRFIGAALAPDGRRLATEIEDEETNQHAVWMLDLARGVRARLSPPPHDSHHMAWSPDGREIAFTSTRSGKWLVYHQRTDGLGDPVLLYDDPHVSQFFARQWDPDGTALLVMAREQGRPDRLWLLPLPPEGKPRALVDGVQGALSPDRRWLAAASMEAGRFQIFVFPFPALDTRWQVSVDGGNWPRWRADGRELFYLSEDRKLMAVAVPAGGAFDAGAPQVLFPLPPRTSDNSYDYPTEYDVSARGDRFVICEVPEQAPSAAITLISDWPGLLGRP